MPKLDLNCTASSLLCGNIECIVTEKKLNFNYLIIRSKVSILDSEEMY